MDYSVNNNLMGFFRSKARTMLLLNFAVNPQKEFYVRELEKKLSISAGNIRRELKKIESSNLITSRSMGNLILYRINQSSPIYFQFRDLILKMIGIQELLKPHFEKEKNIILSFIYGSYAKGEFDSFSDIDIFVLTKTNSSFYEKFNDQMLKFENMLGREFNADYLTLQEYNKCKAKKDPYVLDLLSNPKIFIKGKEDEL